MITQENLKEVLEILGFEKLDSKQANIYTKTINTHTMQVDFANKELIYPQGIKIHDTTTSNFSHPENFVVFECVHRLLEKGYKAESLELEPRWQLGREAKSGKADILVRDNKNAPYLIIECKTTQENNKSKSEFSKEWERMKENGGQLFSYFQQEKATKFLCLYTSDLEAESKSIIYQNYIIQAFDNDEYLQENELEKSYKKASNNTELFAVWKESYKLQSFTQGIFENDVNAYRILETILTFDKLQELKEEGKYHEFAKILRKHNISGKENAFDKLVNIFLCKIYDESFNKNNLKFGYFGVMADTYANMQDRLMLLYKEAMSEFLGEKITFVSNDDIENAFEKLNPQNIKARVKGFINELKFYSNNDFAFLEVHNKELFLQNAIVLKEIIELFAPYKLTQNSTNQFLGNLFELFLQKGMKQDEGQFFTPIQICEFIMYALPLDSMLSSKPLKVLDFACGAGHFLNTYANELKRYATQDLQEHYKQIYGIEKEYRLSKVAKVSSAMYGQNEINILYADALATHELENPKTDKGNKQKPQINNHSFDLLIANPPYSVKGFLETLSDKSKKTYTLFTNEINIETNNAIECFFIERANQLLKDNAKAAIILPSSILNKDGLYKSTREILLINFDFIAIVELGSGTFGATGTNTIILFLHKKRIAPENKSVSQDYNNIQDYIKSGNLQDEFYKDYINAFNAYCDFRGFDKGEYESFLNGSLESYPFGWVQGVGVQNSKNTKSTTQLLELDTFKEYHAAFKETSDYKKLVESKAYKDSKDKDALAHNAFLAYARAIEKDKLLYFSLALNQAPIIIKAPSDSKEQKRFLGYEWSNRKGDEGLKELHSPYLSPLFERDNPHNPNKLAHLIRQAFLESTAYGNHTDSATYKQIYGIEKEYRLSKVAKVSSAMYGQNEINILYADALATHELENPKTDSGNKQKPQINNHSFDLLIANPPYSVKGFLETLSAKSKKTYTLFTNEINIETNNAIECFFIERANQLLRDNAKAAIILPSSILNKDGIYKSTREILLINFDFIAIVELGSGTFGATGTNTIILFLRKKENFTPENATISQDYSNIKNYIESGHLSQNEPYKDYINAFNAYCDFRGFDKGEYESFLNGSLESQPVIMSVANNLKKHNRDISPMAQYDKNLESNHNLDKVPSETKDTEQNIESFQSTTQLLELDTFKEYHAAFKETSEYKKLLDSKAYKDSKDKDTLIHNAFLAYARAIEKDKLLYFSLALNQAPIIIKAPSDNKEQKRFLGYEWSNRKGDEGLKELHSPYLSPLFERDNPHNPNKLAHLIRQAFLESTAYGNHTDSATYHTDPSPCHTERSEVSSNTESKLDFSLNAQSEASLENDKQIESNPIPQDLSSYAFKARLIDMLDFSKVDFNKAISLNPINSQGEGKTQNPFENCKFELVRISELMQDSEIALDIQSAKRPKGGVGNYTEGALSLGGLMQDNEIALDIQSAKRPKGGVGNYTEGALSLGGEHIDNKSGYVKMQTPKYVPMEFYEDFKKADKGIVRKNDILLCKDGALTGKVALVRDEFENQSVMINEHIFLLRCQNSTTNQSVMINEHIFLLRCQNSTTQKFLFFILHSQSGQSILKSKVTGSAQGGLNLANLKDMKIPKPDIEIQKQIVSECEKVEEQYNTIRMSIEKYQELIKAILVKCGIVNSSEGGAVETSSLPC